MGRRGKALLLTGGIALLATLAVLLLTVESWIGIKPVAACGMLWAETALFGGLMVTDMLAKKLHKVFLWAGSIVILPIYALCAFVYSLVCLLALPLALTGFLAGHILLLALAAMALVLVVTVSARLKLTEGDR